MSPDIEVMRQAVNDMYRGEKWKRRVKKMPDEQITAIYMKRQANAAAKAKPKKKSEPDIPF